MSGKLLAVNLATLACSSLFYGAFLVLSSTSMYLLVGRYLATRQSRALRGQDHSIFRSTVFVAAIGLFVAITAHWITTLYRAFLAFIHFQGGDAALEFYVDAADTTELLQNGFLMISILIGDSLIIHRLWVVWEHRTAVVVFPVCTLTALTLCSAVSMYTESRKTQDVFSDPWLTSNAVLTIVTNVYCTGFITFKIWNITRVARPIGGSNLRDFLVIVVESAALYASWAVFFMVTYQTRSVVQFLVIQSAPPLVGIVNALIHTRVGLGWAIVAQVGSPPPSQLAFAKAVAGPTPRETAAGGVSDIRAGSLDHAREESLDGGSSGDVRRFSVVGEKANMDNETEPEAEVGDAEAQIGGKAQ
ncbi:hypothetical protein DFH07DRAFT_925898 [Mycena maculata]|uniref:Uncharacterized protein n=1 Tax=Mycena maculata TaxID=230809 RepID=A0AAD7N2M3_9AGAR|nr:hypothetical protein DFH07DRAFT_925898 [Mycena maculata]